MRNKKLFFGSSYDRGLDIVLKLWPRIIEKFPDATLEVCYGWNLYDLGYADNEERQDWKARMNKLMEQKGITHHGRVSKKELKKIRESCGIWIYPTYFAEINCITALESQASGLVPVVTNYAALKETVQSGTKVDGDIYDDDVQEAWINALFEYMEDENKWKVESEKAKEFAKDFSWDTIASSWEKHFNE